MTLACAAADPKSGAGGGNDGSGGGPLDSAAGDGVASSGDSGGRGTDGGAAGSDATSNGGGGVPGGNDASHAPTGDEASAVAPDRYALNPPRQCDNRFFVPGCTPGDSNSACGGTCSAQSACESQKPHQPDVGFLCPRFILLGDEMKKAAQDDWSTSTPPFRYGVVGHDPDATLDANGSGSTRSCCQCYQLVFDVPNEAEAQVDGKSSGPSAVAPPPPLIVQAFNTAAGGGKNFDVFMGAGGFGAFNACDPNFTQQASLSGRYLYTQFPELGEGGNGGERAALLSACTTTTHLTTSTTLSSAACQTQVQSDCGRIAAASNAIAQETSQSCAASNDPSTFYHLNWKVYAKRVACPTHLTEVTGCKLASQGLPAPDPAVTTATQASADSSFASGYTTTTMQDCCKPTCAWQDNVTGPSGGGSAAVGAYNSFYSCDRSGAPVTE